MCWMDALFRVLILRLPILTEMCDLVNGFSFTKPYGQVAMICQQQSVFNAFAGQARQLWSGKMRKSFYLPLFKSYIYIIR